MQKEKRTLLSGNILSTILPQPPFIAPRTNLIGTVAAMALPSSEEQTRDVCTMLRSTRLYRNREDVCTPTHIPLRICMFCMDDFADQKSLDKG